MPCWNIPEKDQIDAMQDVEAALLDGRVSVYVDAVSGALALRSVDPMTGEPIAVPKEISRGMADVCMIQKFQAAGSFAFSQALAAAEALAGRQHDAQAVALGVHSHDGGGSWYSGH